MKSHIILIFILMIAAYLRFYNLMHDAPYFFNPDERNMANSITQFRLPKKLSQIPSCIISEFIPDSQRPKTNRQLSNSCNLNPHFFAYGQFPLYLAYFSDQIVKLPANIFSFLFKSNIQHLESNFPSSVFWLRFWSALSSTFSVLLVYLITKELINKHQVKFPFIFPASPAGGHFPLFAALSATFTPGLIQAAHFGTTESLLAFFFLASIYLSFKMINTPAKGWYLILLSLVLGLALGTKLTGLFFFIPPFIALMIQTTKIFKNRRKNWVIGLFLTFGSLFFFLLSSPYNLLDLPNFKSSVFGYELDVATGRYQAFYTKQFIGSIPILFQAKKIFPYALGWPIFILGALGLSLICLQLVSKLTLSIISKVQSSKLKVQKYKVNIFLDFKHLDFLWILLFGFWIYFLPNAFLFAKWTRFMTPILPFSAIFSAFALFKIYSGLKVLHSKFQINIKNLKIKKLNNLFAYLLICLLVFIAVLPGIAFMSIYAREDSRVTASRWIYDNIPSNSYILFETANVVDIPLGIPNYKLPSPDYHLTGISFDFYHIDENHDLYEQLLTHLAKADYLFIPSRRIFTNYPRLSNKYPLITKYYQLLFSGALGFEKVTEISSYPSFTLPLYPTYTLTFPDEQSEETFTVFDHPVIRIYRKIKPITREEYAKLLTS